MALFAAAVANVSYISERVMRAIRWLLHESICQEIPIESYALEHKCRVGYRYVDTCMVFNLQLATTTFPSVASEDIQPLPSRSNHTEYAKSKTSEACESAPTTAFDSGLNSSSATEKPQEMTDTADQPSISTRRDDSETSNINICMCQL